MVKHHVKKKTSWHKAKKEQEEEIKKKMEDLGRFAGSSDEEEEDQDSEQESESENEQDENDASISSDTPKKSHQKPSMEDKDDDSSTLSKTENSIQDEHDDEKDRESMDEEDSSSDEEEGGAPQPLPKQLGMANAMSRILSSTPSSLSPTVTPILGKTTTQLQKLQNEEKANVSKLKILRNQRRKESIKHMHIPSVTDPTEVSKERGLKRVATRGVVALFNAISRHQEGMRVKSAASLSESRARAKKESDEKLTKRTFLEQLKQSASGTAESTSLADAVTGGDKKRKLNGNEKESKQSNKGTGWNALKDDFMIGSKLKDWDKGLLSDDDDDDDDDDASVADEPQVKCDADLSD